MWSCPSPTGDITRAQSWHGLSPAGQTSPPSWHSSSHPGWSHLPARDPSVYLPGPRCAEGSLRTFGKKGGAQRGALGASSRLVTLRLQDHSHQAVCHLQQVLCSSKSNSYKFFRAWDTDILIRLQTQQLGSISNTKQRILPKSYCCFLERKEILCFDSPGAELT